METTKLTRDELLTKLRELHEGPGRYIDPEVAHGDAEDLLLAFIDDDEVSKAFAAVPRWYA